MKRLFLMMSVALPFCMSAGSSHAQTYSRPYDPYRWCAQYAGGRGGGENCGFVTLEQCRETIHGMGGFCVENQFYTGPRPETTGAPRNHRSRIR